MPSRILPNAWVVLRFPSGHQRMVQIIPNSVISVGKFGSFPANLLIYRPYHLTHEILDKSDDSPHTSLRCIPASELNAEALSNTEPSASEGRDDAPSGTPKLVAEDDAGGVQYDIVGDDGTVLIRNNRLTIDDPLRQKLSHEEIEALKRAERGGGKEIIAKILENHSALREKTDFSLHKYTVRKGKKYLRRFTVYPVDVGTLCDIVCEQNAYRILEIREETLGLLMSWSNVRRNGGKWLVIDDTGGLIVAAIAERLGILYPPEEEDEAGVSGEDLDMADVSNTADEAAAETEEASSSFIKHPDEEASSEPRKKGKAKDADHMAATANTITVLHPAAQPNTSLLKHFNFPPENPSPSHPLYPHLKTVSWLALLSPENDSSLVEPPLVPIPELRTWKAGRKNAYWRKRRRWERMSRVVEETRAGNFDGLIVASEGMAVSGILRRLVPLVKGGGQVVVYSPTAEVLTDLMDLYSRDRRAAFTRRVNEGLEREQEDEPTTNGAPPNNDAAWSNATAPFGADGSPDVDNFPVNPTLLLAPMLQTVRARQWQVLPGRTHPMMMAKGGAEGYIFSATRVIPAQGRVEARGRFAKPKKRKEAHGPEADQSTDKKRIVNGI